MRVPALPDREGARPVTSQPTHKAHAAICLRCETTTRQPVQARVIDPGSGPLRALYACPDCAPHLIDAEQLWSMYLDHTVRCTPCRTEQCSTARTLRKAHYGAQKARANP